MFSCVIYSLNDSLNSVNDSLSALSDRVDGLDWYTLYEDHVVQSSAVTLTIMYSRKISDYTLIVFCYRDSNKSYIRLTGITPIRLWTNSAWEGSYVNSVGTHYWVDVGRVSDTQIRVIGSSTAVGGYVSVFGIRLHTTG